MPVTPAVFHRTVPIPAEHDSHTAAARSRLPSAHQRGNCMQVTRARTPTLHTRERSREKVESASQMRVAAVQPDSSAEAEGRYDRYLEPFSCVVPGHSSSRPRPRPEVQQQPPASLLHQQPQLQTRSLPSSPMLANRAVNNVKGPSIEARPGCLTGDSNTLAPNKESSHGDMTSSIAQVQSDVSTSLLTAESGLRPPASWSNPKADKRVALQEHDINSPQKWQTVTGKTHACPVAGGQENEPLVQQLKAPSSAHATQWEEPLSSGSSESLRYTEGGSPSSTISFNMSPILQGPQKAATTSPGLSGSSSAASRRESLEACASPPRSKSLDTRSTVSPSLRRQSLVAEKISLWENITATAACQGGAKAPKSTTSSTGMALTRARCVDSRGDAKSRCLSDDMISRSRRDREKDNTKMSRLMARYREVVNEDLPSPSSSDSGSETNSPGKGSTDSPNMQMCKAIKEDMRHQKKLMMKMQQVFLRVVALDSVFEREAQPPSRCTAEDSQPSVSIFASKQRDSIGQAAAAPRPSWRPKSGGHRMSDGKFTDAETTDCHSEMDSSRNSHSTVMPDDLESAREQLTKESPPRSTPGWMDADWRTMSKELKELPTDAGKTEASLTSESADGQTEARQDLDDDQETLNNTSVNSTGIGQEESDTEECLEVVEGPQPGQEGMPRAETILFHFEQVELQKEIVLLVPEGMDETRQVSFQYEDQMMRCTIPEGYEVGQQVTISVPTGKRPALERSALQAWHRGHHNFPDRHLVMEPLRHCCRITDGISLDHPEFKQRYAMYGMMQGKSMAPLLPHCPEGEEEAAHESE